MNILIPLALALILINHQKIKDDQNYRFSVLSIIGVTYFFIFKFVDYYFSIFNHEDDWSTTFRLLAVMTAVGICLSPWMTKSSSLKAGICTFLFAVSVVISFGLERPLKIAIAEMGGYFAQGPKVITSNYSGKFVRYVNEDGGYSLSIPEKWEQKTHHSGADYFVIFREGINLGELRPRCFHKTGIVMPEVVKSLTTVASAEDMRTASHCFKESNSHVCLVKSTGEETSGPTERWHWLAMNPATQQNIDIDILFNGDDVTAKDEVNFILSSLQIEPLPEPTPTCISTMDWL